MGHFSLLIPWVCETHICESLKLTFSQGDYATGGPRQIDVDLMSILCRYVEKKILINFRVTWTYFFDVISMGKYLLYFDVFSLMWFPWAKNRHRFGVTSMSEISTLFRCTFLDLISMDDKSTLFWCIFWCNLDGKQIYLCIFLCDFEKQKNRGFVLS